MNIDYHIKVDQAKRLADSVAAHMNKLPAFEMKKLYEDTIVCVLTSYCDYLMNNNPNISKEEVISQINDIANKAMDFGFVTNAIYEKANNLIDGKFCKYCKFKELTNSIINETYFTVIDDYYTENENTICVSEIDCNEDPKVVEIAISNYFIEKCFKPISSILDQQYVNSILSPL